jgi:hypothetical protein
VFREILELLEPRETQEIREILAQVLLALRV